MKMRNKGKVHPSPSSSSICFPNKDSLSVPKLLPAAILAIATVLSLDDREVLAYMITRSMKATGDDPSAFVQEKNNKKYSSKKFSNNNAHKSPLFDCECFNCYTNYWSRWNSSPNRELIHQAIEALEEHLNAGEQSKRGKNKKRDKTGRREVEKLLDFQEPEAENQPLESSDIPAVPTELAHSALKAGDSSSDLTHTATITGEDEGVAAESAVAVRAVAENNHKGLARKVLPDVLGLFNSRLWSLWSTNA